MAKLSSRVLPKHMQTALLKHQTAVTNTQQNVFTGLMCEYASENVWSRTSKKKGGKTQIPKKTC